MSKKNFVLLIVSFLMGLIFISSCCEAQEKQEPEYKKGDEIVVLFTAPSWCHWCVKQEEELENNPEIVSYMRKNKERFVVVDIDTEKGRKLYNSWGMNKHGVPVWVIIKYDGENWRIDRKKVGFLKSSKLKNFLDNKRVYNRFYYRCFL